MHICSSWDTFPLHTNMWILWRFMVKWLWWYRWVRVLAMLNGAQFFISSHAQRSSSWTKGTYGVTFLNGLIHIHDHPISAADIGNRIIGNHNNKGWINLQLLQQLRHNSNSNMSWFLATAVIYLDLVQSRKFWTLFEYSAGMLRNRDCTPLCILFRLPKLFHWIMMQHLKFGIR